MKSNVDLNKLLLLESVGGEETFLSSRLNEIEIIIYKSGAIFLDQDFLFFFFFFFFFFSKKPMKLFTNDLLYTISSFW